MPSKKRLRVLVGGEKPERSAPSLSLAEALRGQGVDVVHSGGAESSSTVSWIRVVQSFDAIVWVGYRGPDLYVVKQLVLAAAFGPPLIRWWVGTDVLDCIRDSVSRGHARLLARFCAKNIAVAPHLADELASIGIHASVIPSVTAVTRPPSATDNRGRAVLVYLPTTRGKFYGESIVDSAIRSNSDLTFVVVGDDHHRFAGLPNVESLGWVNEMGPVYDRTGCLLRVTEHDGLPRMVIEALLRGKHVIYSHPLAGTWFARTYEQVQTELAKFRCSTALNREGIDAAGALLNPPPEREFLREIMRIEADRAWARRIRAFLKATDLTVRCRMQRTQDQDPPHPLRSAGNNSESSADSGRQMRWCRR